MAPQIINNNSNNMKSFQKREKIGKNDIISSANSQDMEAT